MITAEEAIKLADDYKENFRKQEREDLLKQVNDWITEAAKEGRYDCIIGVNKLDSRFIQEELVKNGFKSEVVPMGVQYGSRIHNDEVNIKVFWENRSSINDYEHIEYKNMLADFK
jgi:hypothetical protein